MYLKRILAGSIAIGLASSLHAYEMKPVGFKAVGMGGAGVASTRGSLAGYYNPALLRLSDYTTEVSLNVGARFREANIANNMDTLSNINFDSTLDNIANNASTGNRTLTYGGSTYNYSGTANSTTDKSNIETATNILNSIGTKNALQVGVTASLAAQISDAFAIGVFADADVGARFVIDTNRLDLIVRSTSSSISSTYDGSDSYDYYAYDYSTDTYSNKTKSQYESSSLEYAVDNGHSYVQLDARILGEVPLSYAKAYDWDSGYWSFGTSIKYMTLTGYNQKVDLGTSSSNANDESDGAQYEIGYKDTFGIDFGIAFQPKQNDLTIGFVGKNLNSPKFKVDTIGSGVSSASDYEIDPYFRAGISYPLWNNNLEFALDVDLQKSETIISGEDTQMIGGGIELHPVSWFALRVGAMTDLASDTYDDGTILTAGLGFGLKWLQIDLSVMASTESGEYDGSTIPRYAAANLSLVSKWGDGYNQKKPPVYETSGEDYTENVAPTKIITDDKVEDVETETENTPEVTEE